MPYSTFVAMYNLNATHQVSHKVLPSQRDAWTFGLNFLLYIALSWFGGVLRLSVGSAVLIFATVGIVPKCWRYSVRVSYKRSFLVFFQNYFELTLL